MPETTTVTVVHQQVADAIREGVASADRGELIAHDRIEAWVRSWGSDKELPPPD